MLSALAERMATSHGFIVSSFKSPMSRAIAARELDAPAAILWQ